MSVVASLPISFVLMVFGLLIPLPSFFWGGGVILHFENPVKNIQVLRKVVLNIHLKMVLPTIFQRLSMVPGLSG